MMLGMVKCPGWAVAMLQNGQPRFANIQPYAGPNARLNDTISFARKEMGGAFSWDEVARYRDKWKGPLVVKGILHPADAEKAVSLGIDGIVVSNHGGRQIEALPAPIDCVPADRQGGRQQGHGPVRFRRAQRHRRRARAGARRACGDRRQGVPLGPRRARRRGAGPRHRPVHR